MFNIIAGSIVIAYAGLSLIKTFQTNRKSKCDTCLVKSSCSQKSCEVDWIETFPQDNTILKIY